MSENSLSFEEALHQLETVTATLQAGEISLEEALALYEQGIRLSHTCTERLEKAKQRVITLSEDADA